MAIGAYIGVTNTPFYQGSAMKATDGSYTFNTSNTGLVTTFNNLANQGSTFLIILNGTRYQNCTFIKADDGNAGIIMSPDYPLITVLDSSYYIYDETIISVALVLEIYIGDDGGKSRKVKNIYIGDSNGKARKVKKAYIGDANGKARLCYASLEYLLEDFNYTTNADGTFTLTGWKGTRFGVASTELVIPDDSRIIL
jgi:hypothetical protein